MLSTARAKRDRLFTTKNSSDGEQPLGASSGGTVMATSSRLGEGLVEADAIVLRLCDDDGWWWWWVDQSVEVDSG